MPKNPLLFPDKFVLDGTVSDSGIGALEIAVTNLSIASKFGAMRQANAIRIGGLGSIKNQNRGMPTLNSLLPTRSVGKFTTIPSEPTGTVGYFIGGFGEISSGQDITQHRRRLDRFTFATTTIANLGAQIDIHAHYTFGNSVYGYYCWAPDDLRFFGRFTFQTESTASIGSVLFPSRYRGASLKNQNRGYACSGISSFSGTYYGNIDRFSFAGESSVSIGTILDARSHCSGFGNKFNGYIAGGTTSNTNFVNKIERLSYATEIRSLLSVVFSTPKGMLATWMPGSLSSTYLMSGNTYGSFTPATGAPVRFYMLNSTEKFTFTGETCGLLGTTIEKGFYHYGAVGNAARCVMAGGITHTDAYEVQNTTNTETNQMRGFTYATETHELLSCVLSIGRRTLAGLDNHGI